MAKWRDTLKAARDKKKQDDTLSAMSDNLLNRRGEMYDAHNKNQIGYTSLSKRWKDLYKRATDYYNNDAFKGFYDTYSGTRKKDGSYAANTGRWYSDLEKQSKKANEGIDELLAELDQYSSYYNEDAVKYVRDLITQRQGSYSDILKDAEEYDKYWSQYATEDDYNNALLMSNAAEAYNSGNYDAAEQALKERAEKLVSEYGDDHFGLVNSEEYKELLEAEDALIQKKEYDEYEPFWNAIETDDLDAAENFINAKTDIPEDEKANYQSIIDYNRDNADYLDLVKNEDFAVNSAYKTTKTGEPKLNTGAMLASNGKVYYSDTGYDDLVYDVINGDQDAYAILYNKTATEQGADTIAFGGVSIAHLQMLEPQEKQIFNYIYATQGKDKAYEYVSHLENRYLYSRLRKEREESADLLASSDPFGSSIATIITSPLKAVPYVMQISDIADDGELTKDAPYNSLLYTSNAMRNAVSEKIKNSGNWGEVGSFAYGVGMSMGDFLMATAVSGGNSTYAGLIMGMGAAADTTLQGIDRGLDSKRAFITGTLAGAAEFFTEKMGVDNLLDKALLDKSAFKYVMKNMLSEGIEEGATDLINWNIDGLYDLISGQDKSEWKAAVAKYMDQGYSESEAFGKALGDRAIQLGTDVAAGAASGGVMGGGGAIMQTFAEGKEGKKYKSDPAALIEEALRIDPNNELALSLQKKLAEGKKISSVELGRLSRIDSENVAEALKKGDEGTREDVKKGIENKIAGKIERNATNEKTISSFAETITKAALGEEVSNAELRRLSKNAAGIAALNNELGLQKKGEKLKVGDSVSAIREAISSKQSSKTKLSTNNILATVAALADMDESAERGLYTSYAADVRNGREVTPEAYAAAYANAMNDGKKGVDLADVKAKYADVLSESSVTMAYRSGENAVKILSEDLQNGEKSDIINTNAQEVQNEQGIHLRDSGERYRGQNTQGQIPGMEGYTRPNQSRREGRAGPRDAEAVNLSYDREVSAKDFNIKGGLESGKVKIVAEGSETTLMKEAKKYAAENGLNAIFFGGGNLKIQSGNKIINARAFIQGKNVYVRVDHADFTADQLIRHEGGHDMIAKGEINIEDVRKRLKEKFTPEEINAVARSYLEAYKDTGLNADEVWTEIICDSLGDMNIFEGTDKKEAAEMAADFLPDLKETALEGRKEARAPPKTQEGKASRESRAKGADYLIYNFSGKINVDYADMYLSDEELAIIASSIKTGWGKLNQARTLGRVYTSEAYYLFTYNQDDSITIQYQFDIETDQKIIDILEEVFNRDKRGNKSIASIGEWINVVRSGQGGFIVDHGNGLQNPAGGKDFNAMDGRSSESDTGRHIESSGEDAQRESKKSFQSPVEAKESGEVNDAHFSIEFAEDIAENQRSFVDRGNAAISAEELETAIETTAKMVEAMKPYANILPQDKVGKTLVKNGSYDMSVENTTICIRTLAYNSFVDMVSEKVGRPLTQMESFLVSQKLYEIAKEPQCLYCYVSLDRKAFNEMVIRYVEQRDAAIEAYKKAGEPKIPSSFNAEWSLFKSFLEGRKPTTNMWDRYVGWIKAYKNGDRLVTLSDISTEAKRAKLVEDGGKMSAQVVDILKYAQSASWAKKQTQYVAYYDEILKLKPGVIKNLNSHYGMRWYSFSDYSGAFIVENMQQVTDAAIRGLKGLSYTKDTDYAEIFAPTGMNINISVYAMKGKDGYVIDPKQSADIDKAIKLRKQYPNVGIVVVATDKAGVEWALAQEWSDVVIPFHTVRTGADVADFYKWEIFNSEQSDVVSDQNLWDAYVDSVGKKKASKNVYPSEHQNNRETYLRICAERGLTPRFNSFIDNPNYMKLVNETRQSEAQTKPLKPDFNLKAAERSFDKFVDKGGYYEGWYNDGIDVDGEADIVAEDVLAGKKANEVDYGRQDISYEDIQKKRKQNREHGHASFDLEMLEDTTTEEQELSDRERLAAMLESDDMSPSQKGLLTKYKNKLSEIEANEAEIAEMTDQLDELKKSGKGNTSRAVVLEGKISKLEKQNAVSEGIILNLEATKPIKRLLERERKAAYQEGLLAGQMAQGKDDAPKLRRAEAKLEAQKQSAKDKLADQRQKSRDKLSEQKQTANEKISTLQKEKREAYKEGVLAGQMAQGRRDAEIIRHANERIEANARAYLESRAKSAERREKTALKKDIRKLAKDINTLLKKSDKKKNVKQEQQTTVATSLALAEILFNDDIRNEDIVRLGVDSVTNEESKLLNKYRDLLDKRDATIAKIDSIYGNGIVKEDLVEQVEAIEKELAKINNSISYLNEKLSKVFERERARHNKSTVDAVFDALITEYSKLANSDNEYVKNAYSEVVKTRLEALKQDLSGTIAKDMSTSQLTEVRDIFKAIKHMISKSNNIFREGREEDLGKYVSNTQKEIFESTTEPKDRGVVINALFSTFNEFSWNNLRPVDAFERLGSKTFEKLFWDYIDGMGVAARDVAEARNVIANAREKYRYSKWNMKLADTTYTTRDGLTFKPTLGDKLSIYAYSKREKADGTKQAMGHMVEGGFTYDTGETYKDVEKGKTYVRKKLSSPYRLSEQNIKGIIASLTQEQRDYVDAILPYLTDMGKKGNEVSMTLYGIELFGDKIYFTLQSSADYLSSTTQELGATQTMSSLANSGFTKQTNPNADNPIVLRAFDDVVLEHIEKMSNYHGLVVPIENLRRVFDNVDRDAERNSLSTKALIGSRFGDEAQKYFSQMLTDFNGGISPSGAKNMFAKLFSKGKAMAVSANLSVVAQQYFSIIRAMEVVNPKYFVPFLNSEAKKTDIKQYEELMKYAPVAIIKEMNGFDVGSSGRVKDYIGYDNARKDAKYVRKKVDDFSMWGASAMDKLGWITIWKAIKAEVASEQKLNPGTKTFYAACNKRFTEVVTKTQVYDSVASRSGYMRSKSDAVKYATSFMGEPTVIMGRYFVNGLNLIRAFKSKNVGKIKKASGHFVRAAAIMGVSQVLSNLAKSLVYAGRDDEEDEAFLEKWAKNFAQALTSDLNPFNSLPFTRDIMSIIEGWDVERPDLTLIADAVTSAKKFHDGITFDEALGFIGAVGNLFGIPFKNIVREIKSVGNAVDDIVIDDVAPTDMGGAFAEGFTGEERTKKETLYNAIVSGDEGRVQAIRGTYKSDDAYKAAVKAALRENDPRIKKAAKAHSNGNIRGFNDYINTIVSEGFFDRNTVASAIRAEQSAFNTKISEAADAKNKGNDKEYKKIVKSLLDSYEGIYSKEEIVDLITKAQKKLLETQDDIDTEDTTSIWKSSDITDALDAGDTDMALDIIAELIEIKLKKKLDEARETAEEKGKDFDEDEAREEIEYEIMSSLRSSLTKHYKPLYYAAYLGGDNKEMNRIRDILITSELYEYKTDRDVDDVLEEWIESYEEE